jgi:outer membrane protein OmpA-like peptidoglycan-associated protein
VSYDKNCEKTIIRTVHNMRIQNILETRPGRTLRTSSLQTSALKPMVSSVFGLTALLVVISIHTSTAVAQSSPVTVDLSVLDDNGMGGLSGVSPAMSINRSGIKLMMPGAMPPKSAYYGPAISNQSLMAVQPQFGSSSPSSTTAVSSLTASDSVSAPAVSLSEPIISETPSVQSDQSAPPAPAAPEPTTSVTEPVVSSVASTSDTIALVPSTSDAPPPPPDAVSESAPETSVSEPEVATQSASLTPATATLEPGRALQVIYSNSETEVPANTEAALDAVAKALMDNDNFRIQLMAFAGDNGLSSSKARRMSLSRALSVRSYLIGQGVRSTRIDVRALGDKTDETPTNRVDINITER